MTDEEEKYFERKQAEWREDVRREKRLEAIQKQEREGIADVLQTSEDVADEALDLGFDQATARVLPLVPLIEMAWADGTVTNAESRTVENLAESYGLEPETEAFDFLELMLHEQPSDLFFERVNRVISHMIEDNPDQWNEESVVDLAETVARASGGFFGLGNPVNEDERELLFEFAALFSVEDADPSELTGADDDQ